MHANSSGKDQKLLRYISSITLIIGLAMNTCAAPTTVPEVHPAATLPCFPGAYYRKAVSSFDTWTGIEAIVKLPEMDYDMSRLKPTGRPLDNASIYLGGRAGDQEIDCGVSWEIIKEADGSVSKVGKAFRPFWRNDQWHSGPAKPEYYYRPGDVIRMKVENTQDGKLLMRIDLLARAGDKNADLEPMTAVDETTAIVATAPAKPSDDNRLTTAPVDAISSFTSVFDASEFRLERLKQFKRVNGLDQSGNEGKAVQPTDTRISNATWSESWLLRGAKRVPMTPSRFTDMRCPDPSHVHVTPFGLTGETVTLIGNPKK